MMPGERELLLPTHLRDRRRANEGDGIRWRRDGLAWTVTQRAVHMGRRGWRHEVVATHSTIDVDGPVQRHDTVWLDVEDHAQQLARAAADQLARGGRFEGLSTLAQRLGLKASAS